MAYASHRVRQIRRERAVRIEILKNHLLTLATVAAWSCGPLAVIWLVLRVL